MKYRNEAELMAAIAAYRVSVARTNFMRAERMIQGAAAIALRPWRNGTEGSTIDEKGARWFAGWLTP